MQDIDSLLKSERLWLKVGCNVSQALRCRETHTYTKRHAHGHPRVSPFASLSMFMLPLDSTNWSAWLCVYCNSATLYALPCLLTWSLIPCSQENIRSMTLWGTAFVPWSIWSLKFLLILILILLLLLIIIIITITITITIATVIMLLPLLSLPSCHYQHTLPVSLSTRCMIFGIIVSWNAVLASCSSIFALGLGVGCYHWHTFFLVQGFFSCGSYFVRFWLNNPGWNHQQTQNWSRFLSSESEEALHHLHRSFPRKRQRFHRDSQHRICQQPKAMQCKAAPNKNSLQILEENVSNQVLEDEDKWDRERAFNIADSLENVVP